MGSSLFKRGNLWWCWIHDETGKLVRKSTKQTDREAAVLVRRKLERRYADPAHYAAHNTTVEEAVSAFIEVKGRTDVAKGTMTMYQQKAGHVLRVFGADSIVATVTAARVDGYITTREDEGASPHTIHKELVTIRQILKHAKRRGAFPGDISEVLPVGYSAQYTPRTASLTEKQIWKLLGQLGRERGAHVAYVIASGARRGEAERATRKATKGLYVSVAGTKTSKAARSVPVVFDLYRKLLDRALKDAPGKALLFRPWGNARRDIHRACDRAGVPLVTWNDLRRTFSSLLRQHGVRRLDDLADLLGHASTAMVRKVYGQDTPEALGASVRMQLKRRTDMSQSPKSAHSKQPETRRSDEEE